MIYFLSFAIGLAVISLLPRLPSGSTFLFASALFWGAYLLVLFYVSRVFKGRARNGCVRLLCWAAVVFCGLAVGFFQALNINDGQLPSQFEGVSLSVTGVVEGLPQYDERRQRFDFRIHTVLAPTSVKNLVSSPMVSSAAIVHSQTPQRIQNLQYSPSLTSQINEYDTELAKVLLGKKVKVSWYRPSYSAFSSHNGFSELAPGQHWRLQLKLKRPRGFVNPAGFDYHGYLLRQGYVATAYVLSSTKKGFAKKRSLIKGSIKGSIKKELVKTELTTAGLIPPKRIESNHIESNRIEPQKLGRNCSDVPIDCWRWNIQKKLMSESSSANTLGALLGFSVGNTQQILDEQWQQLKNTGTIHLLAISGLHVGIAASIGFAIGLFLSKLLAVVLPYCMGFRHLSSLISILFAFAYSALAGMSLPTQRALVMVVLFHLARMFYARISPYTLLSIALCVVLLIDPLALYAQGFWLSFMAVAYLFYGFLGRNTTQNHRIKQLFLPVVWSQWLLLIGLSVPSLLWLQGFSVSAPFANLLVVPWVSLIVIPSIFLMLILLFLSSLMEGIHFTGWEGGFTWIGGFTWDGLFMWSVLWVEQTLGIMWQLIEWFDQWPFWFPPIAAPSIISIILSIVGVIWLLAPKGIPHRVLGAFCFLPLFFPSDFIQQRSQPSHSALMVTFMDVGQGTAVVLTTPNHTMVYDTGRAYSQRFNSGEHIIAPYLRSLGRHKIDHLIVSHNDGDHAGGAVSLIHAINTLHISSGQQNNDLVGSGYQRCEAGQSWQWDGIKFSIIWPLAGQQHGYEVNSRPLGSNNLSSNNQSCVLLVSYKGRRMILAGDIESSVERTLLDRHGLSEVDILLVPHHGSRTSSSVAWVDRLRPKWAVISAGFKHHYGHPHQNVTARYHDVNSQLLNTAISGAIRFSLPLGISAEFTDWKIERWRKAYARYWYD